MIRLGYPRLRWLGGTVMLLRLAVLLMKQRKAVSAIHAHIANTMAAVCCVVGRATNRPVVVKLTGALELDEGILDPRANGLGTRLLRWALRRATYYQAVSSRIASLLPRCGFDSGRVREVSNAVDTDRYQPSAGNTDVRQRLGLAGRRVGVFLGRLTREKALDLLLEAWASAFGGRGTPMLLLVGEGDLMHGLKSLAHEKGIDHQVLFPGSSPDVRPYLGAADFAVLPSSFEGLSNSLLEYMAAGLPVVGSRVSGTEDFVVPGETGWLFERQDMRDLARCLVEVGQASPDKLVAMGREGRRRVEARAAIPAVVEKLAELYGVRLDPMPVRVRP